MARISQCLYCGRKLGLLARFRQHLFCSDEHASIHQRESDLLVIARLLQAESPLDTRRPWIEHPAPAKPAAAEIAPLRLLGAGAEPGRKVELMLRVPSAGNGKK